MSLGHIRGTSPVVIFKQWRAKVTRRIVVDCVAIVRLSRQLCLARSARIFSFAVVAFGK